jgi:hypothetical protein
VSRKRTIGFDRRIDIEWLDAVAAKVASGASDAEVRAYLWNLLEGVVAGEKQNSARGKTVTVLSHIWCVVPATARPLRDRALQLLSDVGPDQRLGLHWAMVIGTYPFATDVATGAGKLLALQGDVALTRLTRRLTEEWGERSTMARAAQRIVRSMVQWGVLADTDTRGVYRRVDDRRPTDDAVCELLAEALLVDADQHVMTVDQLVSHPTLFPFRVSIGAHQLRRATQFFVQRQGLDIDVVGLADEPKEPKTPEQLRPGACRRPSATR